MGGGRAAARTALLEGQGVLLGHGRPEPEVYEGTCGRRRNSLFGGVSPEVHSGNSDGPVDHGRCSGVSLPVPVPRPLSAGGADTARHSETRRPESERRCTNDHKGQNRPRRIRRAGPRAEACGASKEAETWAGGPMSGRGGPCRHGAGADLLCGPMQRPLCGGAQYEMEERGPLLTKPHSPTPRSAARHRARRSAPGCRWRVPCHARHPPPRGLVTIVPFARPAPPVWHPAPSLMPLCAATILPLLCAARATPRVTRRPPIDLLGP